MRINELAFGSEYLIEKGYSHQIIEKLEPSSCLVYRIRKGDEEEAIIKLPNFNWLSKNKDYRKAYFDTLNQIKTEKIILKRMAGLEGIPEFLDFYEKDESILTYVKNIFLYQIPQKNGANLLLKSFIPGDMMGNGEKINDESNKIRLQNIVESLHHEGFIRLELKPKNIIISFDGKPNLIDLGFALTKKDLSMDDFERYKQQDRIRLDRLIY